MAKQTNFERNSVVFIIIGINVWHQYLDFSSNGGNFSSEVTKFESELLYWLRLRAPIPLQKQR